MKILGARAIALVTMLAAAAPQMACAPAAATKAQTEADAMRRETTADRLEATGDEAAEIGDMTRAEQYYVAALKMNGAEARRRERALAQKLVAVCAADGRYPAAIQYATDYLGKHPSDVEVRFASAALSAAIGDTDGARAGFERVVALRPGMAEAHFALGSLLQEENDASAASHFLAYLELEPRGTYAESARASLMRRTP